MNFSLEYKNVEGRHKNAFWFLFYEDKLLVKEKKGRLEIPFYEEIDLLNEEKAEIQHIGIIDGLDCYAAELPSEADLPEGLQLTDLRQAFELMDSRWFWVAGRAYHLLNWMRNNKFCGRCGSAMNVVVEERAVKCSDCGNIVYPRISPAVIVAVTKGDKILLAHSKRFRPGWYSVVAGFVEAGETLEEAVKRELIEEVGIEVKNVKYFGSQPWPFPDSLMIGFTAEYLAGDITVDNIEIAEAGWFTRDSMPDIPGKISIARKLIDWYKEKASV